MLAKGVCLITWKHEREIMIMIKHWIDGYLRFFSLTDVIQYTWRNFDNPLKPCWNNHLHMHFPHYSVFLDEHSMVVQKNKFTLKMQHCAKKRMRKPDVATCLELELAYSRTMSTPTTTGAEKTKESKKLELEPSLCDQL